MMFISKKQEEFLEEQEQAFELPIQNQVIIHMLDGYTLTEILAFHYPNDVCLIYEAHIHDVTFVNVVKFIVIHNIGITEDQTENLIMKLTVDNLPVTDDYIQKPRQVVAKVGEFKMYNTSSYLQNYDHRIVIERIEIV